MLTAAELTILYPSKEDQRDTIRLFDRMLRNLPDEWRLILEGGNQTFREGEWVTTGCLADEISIAEWDFYKISDQNGTQLLSYHTLEGDHLMPHPLSSAMGISSP